MTTYIECGAIQADGSFFPSKAAIQRAYKADPASVRFVAVGDVMGNSFNGPVTCPGDIPAGVAINFVGPNPFSDRRFYGNVKVVKGQVRVV